MNAYDLLRGLHILAVIAWMAGIMYLPRLFAYHVDATPGSEMDRTFQTMELKLYRIIMGPAMVVTLILGLALIWFNATARPGGGQPTPARRGRPWFAGGGTAAAWARGPPREGRRAGPAPRGPRSWGWAMPRPWLRRIRWPWCANSCWPTDSGPGSVETPRCFHEDAR